MFPIDSHEFEKEIHRKLDTGQRLCIENNISNRLGLKIIRSFLTDSQIIEYRRNPRSKKISAN